MSYVLRRPVSSFYLETGWLPVVPVGAVRGQSGVSCGNVVRLHFPCPSKVSAATGLASADITRMGVTRVTSGGSFKGKPLPTSALPGPSRKRRSLSDCACWTRSPTEKSIPL